MRRSSAFAVLLAALAPACGEVDRAGDADAGADAGGAGADAAEAAIAIAALEAQEYLAVDDRVTIAAAITGPPGATLEFQLSGEFGTFDPEAGELVLDGGGEGRIESTFAAPASPKQGDFSLEVRDPASARFVSADFPLRVLSTVFGHTGPGFDNRSYPANTLSGQSVALPPCTLERLGMRSFSVGNSVKLALYAAVDGAPRTLVAQTAPAAVPADNVLEVDVLEPVSVEGGEYFLMAVSDEALNVIFELDDKEARTIAQTFAAPLPETLGDSQVPVAVGTELRWAVVSYP